MGSGGSVGFTKRVGVSVSPTHTNNNPLLVVIYSKYSNQVTECYCIKYFDLIYYNFIVTPPPPFCVVSE